MGSRTGTQIGSCIGIFSKVPIELESKLTLTNLNFLIE